MLSPVDFFKMTGFIVCGALLSLTHFLLVGILDIQAMGARGGVLFNWQSQVVTVTGFRVPYWQMTGIALLGAMLGLALWHIARRQILRHRIAFLTGFSATSVALVSYSLVNFQTVNVLLSVAQRQFTTVESWMLAAGSNSSVHLLMVLALGYLISQTIQGTQKKPSAESRTQ